MSADRPIRPRAAGDLLTVGFAAAVAMWAVGYVCRLPGVIAPAPVLGSGLILCMLGGGWALGRTTARGAGGAVMAGLITAGVNLLVLGAIVRTEDGAPAAAGWVLGTTALTVALMSIGAAAGRLTRRAEPAPADWSHRLCWVALAATTLVLIAGGLVTARKAGLAVRDWPTSFGTNMLLYPLSRMAGNIYYEHAHRLYGMLLGLTSITLAAHLWLADARRWLRLFAALVLVAVVVQGVMGGLRVTQANTPTENVEISQAHHETARSRTFAIAHGVFGQIVFVGFAALAVFTSRTWRQRAAAAHPSARLDRAVGVGLIALMLAQLILGARVRHLDAGVMLHMSGAFVVFMIAMPAAMRAWAVHGDSGPPLKRLGLAILAVVTLQIMLGFGAWIARNTSEHAGEPTAIDAVVTTAHQITGAGLLVLIAAQTLYLFRLIRPETAAPAPRAQGVRA